MIVIVMGVVGAGKTTVGQLLAQQLGWEFADADDFHPRSNREKVSRGVPLNDKDRAPWLAILRGAIVRWISEGRSVVLACSALKESYRRELNAGAEVHFAYLKGNPALIADRLRSRRGHFANEEILASQLEDLEEPKDAIVVGIDAPPESIVSEIRRAFGLG